MLRWFKSLFINHKKKRLEDLELAESLLLKYKYGVDLVIGLNREIKILKQVIAYQEDGLKAIPEAIRSERELRVKLEDLQHKYDSKVNMYRKIISQLEGKNEAK